MKLRTLAITVAALGSLYSHFEVAFAQGIALAASPPVLNVNNGSVLVSNRVTIAYTITGVTSAVNFAISVPQTAPGLTVSAPSRTSATSSGTLFFTVSTTSATPGGAYTIDLIASGGASAAIPIVVGIGPMFSGAGGDQVWSDPANFTFPPNSASVLDFSDIATATVNNVNNVVDGDVFLSGLAYTFGNSSGTAYQNTFINSGATLNVFGNFVAGLDFVTSHVLISGPGDFNAGGGPGSYFSVGAGNNQNAAAQSVTLGLPDGTVFISFSEIVDASTATDPNNYFVFGGSSGLITLGGGNTTFNADNIVVGAGRGSGTLMFGGPGGSLNVNDLSGTGRAQMQIGGCSSSFGACTGQVLLNDHPIDLNLSGLTIGAAGTSNNPSSQNGSGSFSFNSGIVDVTSIIMGQIMGQSNSSSGAGSASGTLTVGGSYLGTASLIVNSPSGPGGGVCVLGDNPNGHAPVCSGTLDLELNGAASLYCPVTKAASSNNFCTINVFGAQLYLGAEADTVGTPASPIDSFNVSNAWIGFSLDGSAIVTNIVAKTVTTSGSGTNWFTIGSIQNVIGPTTFPLISYQGPDPFPGLSGLGPVTLPSGYNGSLVDNAASHRIDLVVTGPISITCPGNVTTAANTAGGAVVNFSVTPGGGCSAPNVTADWPSGSTFPYGTTTVNVTNTDTCGDSASCSFTVTVAPAYFFPTNSLAPTNGLYINPNQDVITYYPSVGSAVQVQNVQVLGLPGGIAPPPLGASQTNSFAASVTLDISLDGGVTFQSVAGNANVMWVVAHVRDAGGVSYYNTTLTQLDISGGTLPSNVTVRVSQTLPSDGEVTEQPLADGFMVSSLLNINTELSLDNGSTWTPGDSEYHTQERKDPRADGGVCEPTPLLPPMDADYTDDELATIAAAYHSGALGIFIRAVNHANMRRSSLAPTGRIRIIHIIQTTVDFQFSLSGSGSFQETRMVGPMTVSDVGLSVNWQIGGAGAAVGFFDLTMTDMVLSNGLPNNVQVRVSQSLPSLGAATVRYLSDGTYRISSYFDVFTELSMDGGNTWTPSTNRPAHVHLTSKAPAVTAPTSNLPLTNAPYVSSPQSGAIYANGIVITNVSQSGFTPTMPMPASGTTNTENLNSTFSGRISMNGGSTFQPFSSPASVSVTFASRPDLDNGGTRYFDSQITQLNVSGGTLPSNVKIRQSPTLETYGNANVRTDTNGLFHVSSYFDVFTELSLDGGSTWSPTTTMPLIMAPSTAASLISVALSRQGTNVLLNWGGGQPPYQVQASSNVVSPVWRNLGGPLTNTTLLLTPSNSAMFYRVEGN